MFLEKSKPKYMNLYALHIFDDAFIIKISNNERKETVPVSYMMQTTY